MNQSAHNKNLIAWFIRRYPRQGKQSKGLISLYYFWVERISSRGKMLFGALFIFFLIELAPGLQVTAFWIIAIVTLLILDWFWPRRFSEIISFEWRGDKVLFYSQINKQILKVNFNHSIPIKISAILSRIPEPFLPMKNGIEAKGDNSLEFEFLIEPRYRKASFLKTVTLQLPGPFGLINKIKKIEVNQTLLCFDKDLIIRDFPFLKSPIKYDSNIDLNNDDLSKSDSEIDHLKEYQNGDPIKNIDHKAWARKGKPIVKVYSEFETLDKKQSYLKEYHLSNFLVSKKQRLNWEQYISSFAKHIKNEITGKNPIRLIAFEFQKKIELKQNEILAYLSELKPDYRRNLDLDQKNHLIEFNAKKVK